MFDPLQSAYRDKHSTETALIKVPNDILSALDAGSSTTLLMLDLAAAFDTIDHDILLSRLCNVYGITELIVFISKYKKDVYNDR